MFSILLSNRWRICPNFPSYLPLFSFFSWPSFPNMLTHVFIFSPFRPAALLSCCINYSWPPVRWVCGTFLNAERQPDRCVPPPCSRTPATPGPRWGLVLGSAERHLAKPQKAFQLQTAWCSPRREFRPKVEEFTKNCCTIVDISLGFGPFHVYFNYKTKNLFREGEAFFFLIPLVTIMRKTPFNILKGESGDTQRGWNQSRGNNSSFFSPSSWHERPHYGWD